MKILQILACSKLNKKSHTLRTRPQPRRGRTENNKKQQKKKFEAFVYVCIGAGSFFLLRVICHATKIGKEFSI